MSDRAVFFAANDGSSGYELWRSDGTADGTQRLLDINPGATSSHPRDLIVRGNLLYFTASDDTNGRQLWSTDTLTNATTRLTSRGMFGPSTQFFVQDRGNDPNLAIAGDTLFLSAYSRDGAAVSGYELWGLDLPSLVSLSLPSDAVPAQLSEDGPRVLPIVFRRSGDTSSPLPVTFRVGGKARLGIDYTLREAASLSATGGSITFAAGASTATLLLDPSSDTLTEDNETVVVALLSGADYAADSISSDLVVTLIDNDVPAGEVAGAPIPPLLAPSSAFESRNAFAFAALKANGSVVAWGDANSGGDISAVATLLAAGVTRVASTSSAFAAPKANGSVITWGDSRFGNLGGDSSAVRSQLAADVKQVFAGQRAFAALKSDGSVVAWGDPAKGGSFSPTLAAQLSAGVVQVFANNDAFAALKSDGSVVAWGNPLIGGNTGTAQAQLNSGVIAIVTSDDAFAALKADGSVISWGWPASGGNSSAVASQLRSGVTGITRNGRAFAALKSDGSVITWGDASLGGNSSAVASQLSGGVVAFARPFRDDRLSFQPAELNRFATLEAQGNTRLLRRGDNVAFAQVGSGTRIEITSPWSSSAGTDTSEWQMVAAETLGGVNRLLWRNNSANFLHSWTLDGEWNWQSSGGIDGFNTPQAWALEVDFQVDANRDGFIGIHYITLEAQGNTTLLRRGDGKAFAEFGAGTRQEITSPWEITTGSESSEWQMLAAETLGGVNRLLWRNNTANVLHTWRLDADWSWTAASGADGLNTAAAWNLETAFQVDANNDGVIGPPSTP